MVRGAGPASGSTQDVTGLTELDEFSAIIVLYPLNYPPVCPSLTGKSIKTGNNQK